MTKRFTAQDAKEASAPVARDYEQVIKSIKDACSDEKNICFFYKLVDKATIALLREDGFDVVVTSCQRGGDMTSIKW